MNDSFVFKGTLILTFYLINIKLFFCINLLTLVILVGISFSVYFRNLCVAIKWNRAVGRDFIACSYGVGNPHHVMGSHLRCVNV